jgi:diphthamide synthase (EF-2-diphthine--ammonia ligase)
VVGLLTTVTSSFGRVSMHGVRESLLDRQIEELALPCTKISIPSPCPNEIYEREMGRVLSDARAQGVTHVVFGDLFLRDIRAYREARLAEVGMHGVFSLWLRDTSALAREMLAAGLRAVITCVDPKRLAVAFAGRTFDDGLLRDLPPDVDPCGENGEFHTFVTAGPMFGKPIGVRPGEVVERDGFVFADLVPA